MPEISRRALIEGFGAGALAVWATGCASKSRPARPARPPNFVVILADFMGYADIEPHGATDIRTPNLTRLASQGVRFSDAYATAPICTPSRAALLTGRYQQRFGVEQNIGVRGTMGLPGSEATVAELLKQSNYRTAMVGKWHLGSGPEFGPQAHGFDQSLAFHDWSIDYFSHRTPTTGEPGLYKNDQPTDIPGYITDIFTNSATSFIDESAANPFFLYVAYNAALPPAQPPNRPDNIRATGPGPVDRTRWDGNGAYTRADYAGTVEALDAGIGRILDALDRNHIADDTVVVFAYDHGGGEPARFAPLTGRFAQLLEGGIRVPLILRWPQALPAGQVSQQPVSLLDLAATMLSAAGAPAASGRALDGIDLVPMLRGATPAPERALFWRYPFRGKEGGLAFVKAARKGRWKYLTDPEGFLQKEPEMLFDLQADVSEQHNVAQQHPDIVRELREAIAEWETRIASR
jgi:arylsulfatase A-like enzyme